MVQEKKKDRAEMDPEEVGDETLSVIVDNDGGAEPQAERDPTQVAADLARALADANAKIAELKDQNLRALAETENVRRRVQRDRDDALEVRHHGPGQGPAAGGRQPAPRASMPFPRTRWKRTKRCAVSPPASK